MTTIIQRLERLRRRARTVLVIERGAVLLATALALLCAWAALDVFVRLPAAMRTIGLLAGLIAVSIAVRRWWWPVVRFRPPLSALALRIERQRPELTGRLASSAEFQSRDPRGVLEDRVIGATEALVGRDDFKGFVRRDRLIRALIGLALAVAIPVTVIALDPMTASIGARRSLLPWSGAEWPARRVVQSLMAGVTHLPRGPVVLLRAEAMRGDPAEMRPFVRYRLVREGRVGPWRDAALARQQGGIFERPLDVDAESIEYQFGTTDALTELATIHLVTPPAVRSASLTAEPPSYAAQALEPISAELGGGLDARSVLASPLLAGSTVSIDFELTRSIPVPIEPAEREWWMRRTFGADLPESAQITASDALSDRVTLRFPADQDLVIPLDLRDEHGISSEEGARYRIAVVADRAPSATVSEPAADEVVLPSASLRLRAEARDDLAVDEVGLRIERLGDAANPPKEHRLRERGAAAAFEMTLTPDSVGAGPGDTLIVSAIATDDYEHDGIRREPTISPPRRIRVVGEEEFTRQVRSQLASVRQAAIRAEVTQRDLIAQATPSEDDAPPEEAAAPEDAASGASRAEAPSPAAMAEMGRRQAQLSDRIRAMRDAVAALEARARAGGLEREALSEIMKQAQDLLDVAGRASAEAAVSLTASAAAGTQARDDGANAPDRAASEREAKDSASAAAEAQESARAELEDLVRLLDRDEDAWIATRKIERLSEEIAKLLEETSRAGERTRGRDIDALSAEERLEIDRVAARDRDAASESRETLEELRDRAERLAQADRTRAAGMQEAARRGEERSLSRRLDEAAEQMAQNQPTNAEQSLREAAAVAQSMMEAIRDDRRSRVEELRRRLAGLEENVRRLVVQAQEALEETRALGAEPPPSLGEVAPVAAKIVALDRNIGAVTDEARSGGGTERVSRLLERAGERSAVSAARLRADPPDLAEGEDALDRARALLVEAMGLVREQRAAAEQQQSEARRRELAVVLRELSERQAGLRTATEPLVGADAGDRRRLVESRRLAVEQQSIKSKLGETQSEYQELSSSDLFTSATARLDGWMTRSADELAQAKISPRTLTDQELAAETLAMMGQALGDPSAGDDPFAEATSDEGDGGGASSGGQAAQQGPPPIPPIAELRLLRETQAQLARRTRWLDEGTISTEERLAELRELSRLQQELLDQGEAWVAKLRQSAGGQTGAANPAAGEGSADVQE